MKRILNPCDGKRVKVSIPDFESQNMGSDREMLIKMDHVLTAKKPAAISLCAEVLNGAHDGLLGYSPPFFRGSNGNVSKCARHAVLAVGRRQVAGKCQYLIRNSWGGAWKSRNSQCACRIGAQYFEVCPDLDESEVKNSKRLEDYANRTYVGCWIDGTNLSRNLLEVGSLK